jgi:hypothetical protein
VADVMAQNVAVGDVASSRFCKSGGLAKLNDSPLTKEDDFCDGVLP